MQTQGRLIIAIAEESGSGKSAIARTVSQALCEKGEIVRLCDRMITLFTRQKQMPECAGKASVGLARREVHLALLDENVGDIMEGKSEINKPLAVFDDDLITNEALQLNEPKVIINCS